MYFKLNNSDWRQIILPHIIIPRSITPYTIISSNKIILLRLTLKQTWKLWCSVWKFKHSTVKYSSLQLSGLRLSVLLKQARFVTRVHAPLCAATFPVLSDYRIIRVFRVSLLPLPTSSALSAVCNMQANCNPVPQFIPVSNMLKYTILL